jgi:hypothetical protein
MRTQDKWSVGVILLVCACGVAPRFAAQEKAANKGVLVDPLKVFRATEAFQVPLALKTKEGKTAALKVGLHTWSIDGALGRQSIRTGQFTLFRVRGGKIRVFLDGKEEMKSTDEYWSVQAGTTVTLQVKGETALLDVLTIGGK